MIHDTKFLSHCIELANLGSGFTAPNPLVGAVLVFENKIIGEGFHHSFGEAHAEVNAINQAIENGNIDLLRKSVLYVNLEPCSHSGKTPPCTDLIIKHGIHKVVIGCRDPNPAVNGIGIKKLVEAGIKTETGILERECIELNRRFITFHSDKRPYVLLKFAQTSNHFISPQDNDDKMISNELTNILVHKWRSEEAAIMVGTHTAEMDNPSLTVRKWTGKNPIRIVIDKKLRLPKTLKLFDKSSTTIVLNDSKDGIEKNIEYMKIDFNKDFLKKVIVSLYQRKILSVMVEGGKNLLLQFIENNLWDEARIITSDKTFSAGLPSPEILGRQISSSRITGDNIVILRPDHF